MLSQLATALLLASSALAVPTPSTPSSTVPFNADAPAVSPTFKQPPMPKYMPSSTFNSLFGGSSTTAQNLTARDIADNMIRGVPIEVVGGSVVERSGDSVIPLFNKRATLRQTQRQAQIQAQRNIAANCVGSWANDTYISSLFYYGGASTVVNLCKNAVIELDNAIFFTAANQVLQTVGGATGSDRATLVVTGADQSCAIYGAWDGADNIILRNVQIDGNRENLGIIYGGLGLLEFGGNTVGQVIDNVHSFEPRGWTALHAIEGYNNYCTGMQITNNQIGPSGHAPSGAQQFRRRDSTGTYTPGQWADGISVACKGSLVQGNTITDATDGAIVLFGAPGTQVKGNTIIANDRQLLGGINMVDWSPFSGSFEGTVVSGNTINANTNFIKVGVPLGGMTWGVDNRTVARTFGGSVIGNTFISGSTGYFGYAIGMAGHENATILNNNAKRANFGSIESSSCFTSWFPLPNPQSWIRDQWTTPGGTYQKGFSLSTLVLLICRGPSSVTTRGGLSA
ncbi:hypothetical protein T439DRAFT_323166 [Meredithblackwellia eburnea MCA 4105]